MAMGERASSLVTRAFKVNYGDDVRIKSIRTAHPMRIQMQNCIFFLCLVSNIHSDGQLSAATLAIVANPFTSAKFKRTKKKEMPAKRNFPVEFQSHN